VFVSIERCSVSRHSCVIYVTDIDRVLSSVSRVVGGPLPCTEFLHRGAFIWTAHTESLNLHYVNWLEEIGRDHLWPPSETDGVTCI